jgi:hypothetical protein
MFNMRESEERGVLERSHWLCIDSECVPPDNCHSLLQRSASDLRTAMLAFQIWAPKGWMGVIVNSELTSDGLRRVVDVKIAEPYAVRPWANLLKIDNLSVDELKTLIDGALSALQSESVLSRNPFQYLEIGLQTAVNHGKAGALLWMIGLDALLGAQGEAKFSARLCRLLGRDTRVFPDDYSGRRPAYTIGEVASDIYRLRNQIAHGDRIRPEYIKKSEFRLVEPLVPYYPAIGERSRQSILCEAALFTLCGALRKVILGGHLDRLQNQRAWKRWLDEE